MKHLHHYNIGSLSTIQFTVAVIATNLLVLTSVVHFIGNLSIEKILCVMKKKQEKKTFLGPAKNVDKARMSQKDYVWIQIANMGKLPNDKQAHKNVHQPEIGGSANLQNICLLIHILLILFQHIFYEQKQICICHFVNW